MSTTFLERSLIIIPLILIDSNANCCSTSQRRVEPSFHNCQGRSSLAQIWQHQSRSVNDDVYSFELRWQEKKTQNNPANFAKVAGITLLSDRVGLIKRMTRLFGLNIMLKERLDDFFNGAAAMTSTCHWLPPWKHQAISVTLTIRQVRANCSSQFPILSAQFLKMWKMRWRTYCACTLLSQALSTPAHSG